MDLDAVFLSRIQFAFTIAFHIIFPSLTIGLASLLAVLEGLWLTRKRDRYLTLYMYWLRMFAICFALGVVSGVVMSYQFGTNWSRFSEATGNILGPLLGYEVLTAFFLEASFLGIMLFGWKRVGNGLHFFATCMVALGTLISTFWILAANSWMHTPAGFELRDGIFYATDWLAVIFNPSMPYRIVHMVLAAYLTTGFVVAGVSAYNLIRDPKLKSSVSALKMAAGLILILVPAQFLAGHEHGLNVYDYQPAKIAAMEAHWDTKPGQPLILFALPDEATETNRFELSIPSLGSLMITHSLNGVVRGLKETPRNERPPVAPVFWSFRVMVGVGILMALMALWGGALMAQGRLAESRWYHRASIAMLPSGIVAVISGWIVAEVGRQPYTVYGILRTTDSVSPVTANSVGLSLMVFVSAYAVMFGAGIYYLWRIVREGPEPEEIEPKKVKSSRVSNRRVSARKRRVSAAAKKARPA